MNYLELVNAAARDGGLVSKQNRATTLVDASGITEKLAAFVEQAWRLIQLQRNDWEFRRGDFSHALVIGQAGYTPLELGITRCSRFASDINIEGFTPHSIYDAAIGAADTCPLYQISPEVWESAYGRGVQTQQRPTDYSLRRGVFCVGPHPDKAYIVQGQYWKGAQSLSLDADEPELPEDFHDVIKWKALMLYSGQDGALNDRELARMEYAALMGRLVSEQTRSVDMGPPIA